ncbi:MAG TPA: lipoprotein insertase outer membrane protein LolB [Caldimonas sp.]|nr:lipoprotein insertase outer membrane protein LolB [Caldimonas sp.]
MPRPTLVAPAWRVVALASAALAAACTTVPPAGPAAAADVLSGRLALRVEPVAAGEAPRSMSAAFDLRGDPRAGTLGLSTPLGSLLAQARWSPAEVVLTTPRETRRFASLDELTREALGESVPIEAWFDWLRGRPWPGASSALADATPGASSEGAPGAPSAARPPGFRQLGWRVDLSQFDAGTIAATRESPPPVVTVRIRLDGS